MEFEGTIFKVMPATSGQSARGPWQRQEVVFDVKGQSQYPRKVCVTFFNKADEVARLAMGVEYVVSVDIESREYNGKWYTDGVTAAEHQRDCGFRHTCHHFRNGETCFNVSAHCVQYHEHSVNFAAFLN